MICFICIIGLFSYVLGCGGGGGSSPNIDIWGCKSLVETTPRGVSTLQCNIAPARPECESIIAAMGASCISHPALNYLVDDTFGFDLEAMRSDIHKLSSGGRTVHVLFYLYSGPTQRRYKTQTYGGFGTKMSPEEFRNGLWNDPSVQSGYKNLLVRILPLISDITSLGGSSYISIGLEDNLTDSSAERALWLLRQVDSALVFGRSPCQNCWPGNGGHIPDGMFQEDHLCYPESLNQINGWVTNDGKSFVLVGQPASPGSCPIEAVRAVRDKASSTGNTWLLWNEQLQGLVSSSLPDPMTRPYVVLSQEQISQIGSLLRGE